MIKNSSYECKSNVLCQLVLLEKKSKAVVQSINCDKGITCRLASLGIYPDRYIEVVLVTRRGSVLVKVNGMLLAISSGISKNILVKEISCDA